MRRIVVVLLFAGLGLLAWLAAGAPSEVVGSGPAYQVTLPLFLVPMPTPSVTCTPTATPLPTATPTATPPPVSLLSYSVFRPSAGSTSLYVVGEVQSNGPDCVRYVKARFTLYDAAGGILDSDYALTTIGSLPPGQKSPFQIVFSSFTRPWASCEPYLSWEPTSSGPHLLAIRESSSYYAGAIFHVRGWAHNVTAETRTYVDAIVTAYDRTGRAIGTGHAPAEPRTVDPDQLTFFDVPVTYYEGKPSPVIASYALVVVDD